MSATAESIVPSQRGTGFSLRVHLNDGRTLVLAQSDLELRRDGSYYYPRSFEDVSVDKAPGEEVVVPVIEERVEVEKRVREVGGVRVHKRVHEEPFVVDEVLSYDEIQVARVPVNQYVSGPVSIRYENDTTIVPVLEEVLVTEKRLVLREEVHVTKQGGRRRRTTREIRTFFGKRRPRTLTQGVRDHGKDGSRSIRHAVRSTTRGDRIGTRRLLPRGGKSCHE